MEEDEGKTCHMCPTTEEQNGAPLRWEDFLQASLCRECVDYFDQGKVKADAV